MLLQTLEPRAGPLVALGSPRDFNPPDGAAREYVHDADWQQTVAAILEEAIAVVFLLSRFSDAIAWELALARQRKRHDDVVVLIPPRLSYLHELPALLTALELSESDATHATTVHENGLIVGFDASWRPFVLADQLRDAKAYAEPTIRWFENRRAGANPRRPASVFQ